MGASPRSVPGRSLDRPPTCEYRATRRRGAALDHRRVDNGDGPLAPVVPGGVRRGRRVAHARRCSSSSEDSKRSSESARVRARRRGSPIRSRPRSTRSSCSCSRTGRSTTCSAGCRAPTASRPASPIPTSTANRHRRYAIGNDFQACGDKDPAHDWQSMVKHYNGGKCDGWLKTQTTGDHFPIGYYEQAQVPILGALAHELHALRQLPLLADGGDVAEPLLPAVRGDRRRRDRASSPAPIADAAVEARPRHLRPRAGGRSDDRLLPLGRADDGPVPVALATTTSRTRSPSSTTTPRRARCRTSRSSSPTTRPVAEFLGTSNDYHPHGNIQVGEGYVAQIYDALAQQPAVGPHGVRRQLRRERRLLRPRRAADGEGRQRQPEPGPAAGAATSLSSVKLNRNWIAYGRMM